MRYKWKKPQDLSLFQDLPDHLKAKIIGSLPIGRVMCKDTRHIFQNQVKSLWIHEKHRRSINDRDSLDLNQYPNVTTVSVFMSGVGIIDVHKLQQLNNLNVLDCIRIYQLSLPSYSTNLVHINLTSAPYIDQLDVSMFPNLTYLECRDSWIRTLDLTENAQLLSVIVRNSHHLEVLKAPKPGQQVDLEVLKAPKPGQQVDLEVLKAPKPGRQVDLEVPCRLLVIDVSHCTVLKRLDLEHCKNLNDIMCAYCVMLTDLLVSDLSDLRGLDCEGCEQLILPANATSTLVRMARFNMRSASLFTDLDTTKMRYLRRLVCDSTNIDAIDVSQCPYLEELDVSGNILLALDVTHNRRLKKLWCDGTEIPTLDLTKNTKLELVNCSYNMSLQSVQLPPVTAHSPGFGQIRFFYANHTAITQLDWSALSRTVELRISATNIGRIDLSNMSALKYFDCCETLLDHIDIRECHSLQTLVCKDTFITTIDTRQNAKLRCINCSNTDIIDLDVSQNTDLVDIQIHSTNITCLNNLHKLPKLRIIDCTSTHISSLDISENHDIQLVKCSSNVTVITSTAHQVEAIVCTEPI